MKKQTARPVDRQQDRYLREIEDRLRNRPTFDPLLSLNWPLSPMFELKIF